MYIRIGRSHRRAPPGARITIVGAGPVGCRTAELLAREGLDVCLLEGHPEIGTPCHCTGIVTRDLLEILDVPPRLIVNSIERLRVVAPDGRELTLPSGDIVLDRVSFDRLLAERAAAAGARLLLGHRFLGMGAPGRIRVRAGESRIEMATDVLVGADGPASTVARSTGMAGRRRFYAGLQLRLQGRFEPDVYEVHLVVPQFFGWVVPESSSVARVGVASRSAPRRQLEALLGRLDPCAATVNRQWGLIPIYDPATSLGGRSNGIEVRLVGDAATLVKATTGGGLVPGLLSAQSLHESLMTGASYRRTLAPVRRRLAVHLAVRGMLNCFSDSDYDRLVGMCAGDRVRDVLAAGSRDRPARLLWNLLRAEPALASFGAATLHRWSRGGEVGLSPTPRAPPIPGAAAAEQARRA